MINVVIIAIIMIFMVIIKIPMTMIISQDEHRFTRPVLASQRGFTAAREQDDVRGLQYRGGHGYHHTGAWSMITDHDHHADYHNTDADVKTCISPYS